MGEVCGQNTAQILALTVQTGRRERERGGELGMLELLSTFS